MKLDLISQCRPSAATKSVFRGCSVQPGQSVRGELGGLDEEDCYSVSPADGREITFTLDQNAEAVKVTLQSFDRREFWYSGQVVPGTVQSFELPQLANPPLFIRVFEGRGAYSMEIR